MNWVGGVRNRLKTQHEKKLQQEFFEKKRFNKKVEKAKSKPCRSDKKLTISQDLQSLKTIERIYCSTDNKKDTETKHKTKRPVKEVPLANTPRSRLDLNCNLDLHMSPCKEPSKIAIMDPRSSAQWKLPDSIKAPRPPHCDIEPIRSGHAQYNLTSNSTRYRQTRLGSNQYESSPNDLTRDNRSVNMHSGITGSDITARREISYDAHQAKIGYNSTLQLNKPVIQNADLDNDISMYSDIFRGSDKYETPWLSHKYGGPNVTLSINSNRGHSTVTSGDLEQRDNAIRVPKRPLPQFASDMKRQEEENFQETPLRKYKKHRDCSKHKHTVDYNSLYDDEQYICKNYTPEYAPEVRNTSSRRNIQQKKKVESTPVSDPSPSYMLGLRKLLLGNTPQKRPSESPPHTPVVYKPNIQNTDLQRDKYTKPINTHKTKCNVISDDCHKSEKEKLTIEDQSSAPNFQSHGIRKDDTTDKTQNSAIGQKKQGEHVQKKDVQEKEQSCMSEKADEAIIEKHSKDKKSQHIQFEQPKQLNILMQCNKVSSEEKELEHNSPVNQPIKQHRSIGSQTSPMAPKKRIVKLYANNATQTDISFINTKNKSIQCEPLTSECNIQVNIGDVRMTPTNIVHSTSSEEVSVIATNVEDSADASAGSNEEEELVADDSGSTFNSLRASGDDIDISPTPKHPAEHGTCIVDSTDPIDIRNNRTPNIMVDQVNMPSTPSYKDRPIRPLSSSVDDSGIVSPVSTYASSVGIPDANATLSPSGAHDVTADLSLHEQQMSKMAQSSNATLYSQGTPLLNASPLNTVADLQGTPPAGATLNASDNNQHDEDPQEVEFITCEVTVNPRDKGESDKITGDVRACQL